MIGLRVGFMTTIYEQISQSKKKHYNPDINMKRRKTKNFKKINVSCSIIEGHTIERMKK